MEKIEILTAFSHRGQSFYPGEVRVVSESDAGYFCGVGWAKSAVFPTGEPDLSEKTLEVKSGKNSTGAKVHG